MNDDVSDRLKHTKNFSVSKTGKNIIIVPANKSICLKEFSNKLLHLIQQFQSALVISDYQEDFRDKNASIASVKEKINLAIEHKKSAQHIIFVLQSYDTPLARCCFKKVDKLFIAAFNHITPHIDSHILDKLHSRRLHLCTDPELILLHTISTPGFSTSHWLAQTPFSLYHHIKMDVENDFYRLLRFIRGKAVGLVLSGGGTRGWAHLGVIKALREAKISIDMIGGTSVGALVAACYAMNESYEDAYEKFQRIVIASNHSISWRNITWPSISLFNAKNFTQAQMDVFQKQCIEDLSLPYFCVSCNLSKNAEEVHQQGILWEKTRASASIPGLIPPMLINDELHLDGGLLNNLPVDIMRRFVGDRGKVIAVELNNFSTSHHKYEFPPILTLKETLRAKLGLSNDKYQFPRFIEIFLRGLFIGSLSKSKQNGLAANIFISLNLTNFRILQSKPKQVDRLIEIGYEETWKQIDHTKKKETNLSREELDIQLF